MDEDQHAAGRNAIERRLAAVGCDVAVIRSNYATKEDLAKLESRVISTMQDRLGRLDGTLAEVENRLIRWFFATSVSLATIAFTAGKFL